MRALHLNPGNLYGGVETMLVTLAREAPWTPGLTPRFGACVDGRYTQELAALGCPAEMLGAVRLSRPDSVLRARRRLTARLRAGLADVVVCHQAWSYAVFGPAARRAGVPVVLWLHTVSTRRHWLERWAARRAPDLVIANSRYTAAAAAAAFPRAAITTVYCPLSRPADHSGDGARHAVRAALGTPSTDVVIVQVGRFEALKGHHTALQALTRLSDVPGWTYWIAGGAQRESDVRLLLSLQGQVRESGLERRVRFLGERTDVPRLLQAADVYCQPNDGPESFGLSLVEAMLAGLPVVASGIGGALEIVDQSCGVLTPAGDVDAVAGALRRCVTDTAFRTTLSAGARLRPDVLCNAERQMQRIEAALAAVAAAPPALSTLAANGA